MPFGVVLVRVRLSSRKKEEIQYGRKNEKENQVQEKRSFRGRQRVKTWWVVSPPKVAREDSRIVEAMLRYVCYSGGEVTGGGGQV